ncbi:peptidylprolyl isomerase [Bacteriovorax sp. Seq25_V]|uniref:peptidylprolyl isomerase n=1 Tax=Bacteriovorax sp. Seq25_V TaxID=1201288 RepID=UPI00038A32F3|nr:peptidylprolyl isomerase [Bacteriovorax sp. Seq25_V]EQC43405.1 PPIC-type PPIASE domain protein [Bacteriovorax sp. Seq25_V]
MLRKFVLISAIALISFAETKDPVVAEVNGKKITKSDLDKAYLLNRYVVSNEVVTMKKVLDDIINKEIGIDRAKKSKLDKDPVVLEKMEEVLFNAQVSKDLEPEFQRINVTDKDVEAFYKDFPEYRTAHILLRVRVAPSEVEVSEAQKKIFEIYEQVKKDPKKFAELANKYSQSPNAETGGDVGYQPAFFYAPEYYKAIKGKEVGFITTPVRTQYGYHIVKILGVKEFKDINKPAYQKFVYDQKRDKIIDNYFAKLRKSATVKVLDPNLK